MISKDNLKNLEDNKLIRIISLSLNVTPNGKILNHFVSIDGLNSTLIVTYDSGDGFEHKFKYLFNYMSPAKNSVTMNGFVSFLSKKGTNDILTILNSKTVSNPKTLLEIRNGLLEAAELGDLLEVKFLVNSLDTYIHKQEKRNKAFKMMADIARKVRSKMKNGNDLNGGGSTNKDNK